MIVSHKYRLVLVRPTKTGGSSIEAGLCQACDWGPDDVVTAIYPCELIDETEFRYEGQNSTPGQIHSLPRVAREVAGDAWADYHKVCLVRNPWDREVSNFWFLERNNPVFADDPIRALEDSILPNSIPIEEYACGGSGIFWADQYIQFENLQGGFDLLCGVLGLQTRPLLRLKTKSRQMPDVHFSQFFSVEAREAVRAANRYTIEKFGYRFRAPDQAC